MELERRYSLKEAQEILGLSERTVHRWIKSGKLKSYKPGRDHQIPESAIKQVIEESEVYPKDLEPSLPFSSDESDAQRRLRYLRAWRAFVYRTTDRWEEQPPTSREVATLFDTMTALVDQGVFDDSDVSDPSEQMDLMLIAQGFERLNEIADSVEKDEEAEQRRATFTLIQENIGA